MSSPQTPDGGSPPRAPASHLPPLAYQILLRVLAALAHVIFVAGVMQDYSFDYGLSGHLTEFAPWQAWTATCREALHFFANSLVGLAPWAVVECLTVAMVFGVPFQFLARLCAAAGLSVFAVSALGYYQTDQRLTQLLFVITECITVVLVLVARSAGRADWRPVTAFFTMAATFYFFALDFGDARSLIPEKVGVTLQSIGVAWQIFAKLSLGRSFGLLPADRGIVTHGAYRVIRHPIYLGYFIAHVGFLLANFSGQNLAVFALLYSFQLVRVVKEERLLRGNPEYQAYCQKVRWRFLPWMF